MVDLFDFISAITSKKGINYLEKLEPEDRKKWSSFMCIKFLSMDYNIVTLVNEFQPYVGKLTEEEMFKFLYVIIPSGYHDTSYKGKKLKKEDAEVAFLAYLCEIFEISKKEASDYLSMMTKSQLSETLDNSNLSDTHIKNFKKLYDVK